MGLIRTTPLIKKEINPASLWSDFGFFGPLVGTTIVITFMAPFMFVFLLPSMIAMLVLYIVPAAMTGLVISKSIDRITGWPGILIFGFVGVVFSLIWTWVLLWLFNRMGFNDIFVLVVSGAAYLSTVVLVRLLVFKVSDQP